MILTAGAWSVFYSDTLQLWAFPSRMRAPTGGMAQVLFDTGEPLAARLLPAPRVVLTQRLLVQVAYGKTRADVVEVSRQSPRQLQHFFGGVLLEI